MNRENITTLLYLDGLKGIRIHKMGNENLRCIELNRNNLKDLQILEKGKNNSGIYFLLNQEHNQIYIGQAIDIQNRLKSHLNDEEKSFTKVYFFIMDNNDFSKTFIDYLEWHYINRVINQSFYTFINKDMRKKEPIISEFDKPIVEKIIQGINVFLLFCNIDLNILEQKQEEEIFFFKEGELIYSAGIFILLKNSKIKRPAYQNTKSDESRIDIWFEENAEHLQKIDDKNWILTRDISINSPSFAGRLCSGNSAQNGWTAWNNKNQESLDFIYRKTD